MATVNETPELDPQQPALPRRSLAGRLARNELMLVCGRLGLLSLNRIASVLMAGTIVIAAIASFLQVSASAQAGDAGRRAQQYAILETADRVLGQSRVSAEYRNYQTWSELDWASLAQTQQTRRDRYEYGLNWIRTASPLFNEPYWREGRTPNIPAYEADTFVRGATETAERQAISADQKAAWSAKGTRYFTHLTFLAVALFLFGLTISMPGKVRWVFLGGGIGFTLVASVWLIYIYFQPIPERSQTSIQEYAAGEAFYHQGLNDAAIEKFEKAAGKNKDYPQALIGLGDAYIDRGYSNSTDWDAATEDFKKSLAAYKDALKAGKSDPAIVKSVNWSTGWLYYLLGDFNAAIKENEDLLQAYDKGLLGTGQKLELDSGLFAVRLNLALAHLVNGDAEEAKENFDAAVQAAIRQVEASVRRSPGYVASDLWSIMDASALDFQNVMTRLDQVDYDSWVQAPTYDQISEALEKGDIDEDDVYGQARDFRDELRSLTVALQRQSKEAVTAGGAYNKPFGLGPKPTTSIDYMDFGVPVRDDQGRITRTRWIDIDEEFSKDDSFPYLTAEVTIYVELLNMVPGKYLFRVFLDGEEQTLLRATRTWVQGDRDWIEETIGFNNSDGVMKAGHYTVEAYFQDHLLHSRGFDIVRR